MTTFVQMSLAGSGIIAVPALLRFALRDRLPRAAYLCLWAAAIVRLLSPVMFSSPISLFGRMPAAPAPAAALPPAAAGPGGLRDVLPAVWLCGVLACFAWFLVRELRARHALRAAEPVRSPEVLAVLPPHARRWVRLRADARLAAPLAYGFLRPVIVLPVRVVEGGGDPLRFSLLHEMGHIRHGDYLWKALAACAVCVHWFNPLAWLMFSLLGRDLEIACDARVLRRCKPGERAAYAHSLLDCAASVPRTLLANHFSQNPLEERIVLMMSSRKISLAGLALATALVLGTTSAFAASNTQTAERAASAAGSAPSQTQPAESDDALDFEIVDTPESPAFKLDASKFVKMEDGSYRYTFDDDGSTVVVTVTTGVTFEGEP